LKRKKPSFFSGAAGASLPCIMVLQRSIIWLMRFIIPIMCSRGIGRCGIYPGPICAAA